MFDDYREKVILTYEEKKKANAISLNLLHLTPGNIREECIKVYEERPLKKDENLLRSFFESKGDTTNYSSNIKATDIDKFRPLINFIRGKTVIPESKNVELLAWLIDFEPRPYKGDFDYVNMPLSGGGNIPVLPEGLGTSLPPTSVPVLVPVPVTVPAHVTVPPEESGQPISLTPIPEPVSPEKSGQPISPNPIPEPISQEKSGSPVSPTPIPESISPENSQSEIPTTVTISANDLPPGGRKGNKSIIIQKILAFIRKFEWLKHAIPKSKKEKAAISLIIIFTIASITYLIIINNKKCMYWTGEHYEAISCEQTVGDVAIIAKDTVKLNHLKKIMHPDTLTQNSLGKVWYVKTYEGLEFYTSDGFHPIYSERRLRPITMRILNKYILKNQSY